MINNTKIAFYSYGAVSKSDVIAVNHFCFTGWKASKVMPFLGKRAYRRNRHKCDRKTPRMRSGNASILYTNVY